MHYDHTMHVTDLSLWLGTLLTPKHVHVYQPSFHLEERSGMDVQTKRDILRTVEDIGQVTIE